MDTFEKSVLDFLKQNYSGEIQLDYSPNFAKVLFPVYFIPNFHLAIQLISLDRTELFSASLKEGNYFSLLSDRFDQNGIRLIHLWEDFWHTKNKIVKSRLLASVGKYQRIHGRKVKVSRITNPQLLQFLEANHLQVPIPGKHKYGLIFQDELVAVASFSHGRKIKRHGEVYKSYELLRFCNKKGITVTGGFSKLLSRFLKDYQPDDIMTYADRDWSYGKSYITLGFEVIQETPTQLFLVDKSNFQRFYPDKLLQDGSVEKAWAKAYNAGNLKFILDLKKRSEKHGTIK
ncbi:hypothetical protein [Flexithrix dorotheae]|uniref:hypothetical protein n=1 Tax=Flexithrix dorotheae TaxID=70993 RepID=UPI00037E0A44|nr:hypothetical protein [Flexithrix dorotheae]